jgi:hypothetical protein
VTPCEQCRRAPATVELSFRVRCATPVKRLCDACARTVAPQSPFALKPLERAEKK